jgi:hypothetical protein
MLNQRTLCMLIIGSIAMVSSGWANHEKVLCKYILNAVDRRYPLPKEPHFFDCKDEDDCVHTYKLFVQQIDEIGLKREQDFRGIASDYPQCEVSEKWLDHFAAADREYQLNTLVRVHLKCYHCLEDRAQLKQLQLDHIVGGAY